MHVFNFFFTFFNFFFQLFVQLFSLVKNPLLFSLPPSLPLITRRGEYEIKADERAKRDRRRRDHPEGLVSKPADERSEVAGAVITRGACVKAGGRASARSPAP